MAHLARQGFAVLLPRHVKTVKHARKFRTIEAPLFPGYLFVSLHLGQDRWRSINGTFGVRSLIMAGERPVAVPKGIVESLIAMQDFRGRINFAADLHIGQRAKLLAGPFADMVGELEWLNEAGRVRVLLELMGKFVRVDVRAENLVPA